MRALVALVIFAFAVVVLAPTTGATAFTVDATLDVVDANVGDGICATATNVCTLRAAIQEANADTATADTITLPAGTFTLTIAGANEDAAAAGDLDLLGPTTITGAGSLSSIIDANNLDRAFDARGSSFTLSGVTVRNGTKSGISAVGTVVISNAVVTANTNDGSGTSGGGGGIEHRSAAPFGPMTLTNVAVTNNAATWSGGGISEQSSGGTWTNVTVSGNTAPDDGGGVYYQANFATVTILDSIVRANTSTAGDGGGIYASGASTLTIRRTEISGNAAQGGGSNGGGMQSNQRVTLENVTVSGNASSGLNGRGGGVALLGSTGHRLEHVTITSNTATTTPSGLLVSANVPPTTTVKNSIIAGNGGSVDCEGDTLLQEGRNLQDSHVGCGFAVVEDPIGVEPLSDNGGFSKTHGLRSGSSAIDAASSCTATTDQRGVARPDGAACDLGAFEGVIASTFPLTVSTNGSGSVTSSPAGIACGSTCSATYASGTTVTLTASADATWSGCDSSAARTCSVTMSAARAVTATFSTAYTLGISRTGTGSGSVECDGGCSFSYPAGTSVTLRAYPAGGSAFSGWTGCDNADGTVCTVTLSTSRSVVATFTNSPPLARITSPSSVHARAQVIFSGANSTDLEGGIASYRWSFGDGATADGISATHAYETAGSYTVTLIVTDVGGRSASATMNVDVVPPNLAPTPWITASLPDRKQPLLVRLDASASTDADGRIVRLVWRRGTATIGATPVLTTTFPALGTYVVAVLVTDNDGATAVKTLTLKVGSRLTVVVDVTEGIGAGEAPRTLLPATVTGAERVGVTDVAAATVFDVVRIAITERVGVHDGATLRPHRRQGG